MAYTTCTVPAGGKISIDKGKLQVPANPIIPFIRGDGTGPDIWAASERVLDAAVAKAYGGQRQIAWMEVFAGEEAFKKCNSWLPDDTITAISQKNGRRGDFDSEPSGLIASFLGHTTSPL